MRRRVEPELRLEPAANGSRLFVGGDSHGVDSRRRRRRDRSVYSKTFRPIVRVTWFLGSTRARLNFYDSQSSLVRTSKSVLRVVSSHAALFLWRAGLGNADTRQYTSSICSCFTCAHLDDEQF